MLPELLSDLSDWTWAFLRDAPFRPREETVTESLLVEFARRGTARVWLQKATVDEEAALGLDWAWAIRTPGGWLLMLVQAKNARGVRWSVYQELRDADARQQADRLIRAAAQAEALPLYAFYNTEAPPFGGAGTSVEMEACGMQPLSRQARAFGGLPWVAGTSPLGVTFAHALDVRSRAIPPPAINQRTSSINTYAMPWECLLCPNWLQEGGSAVVPPDPSEPRLMQEARNLGRHLSARQELGEERSLTTRPHWMHASPPAWATLVQELRDASEDPDAPPAAFYLVVDALDERELEPHNE